MDLQTRIIETLKESLGSNDQAFLYGSRAKGTARADSDWDILIVLDKDRILTEDYDRVSYPLAFLGWDSGQIISPVLYTKREWSSQRFTPFFSNVKQDSIQLI